MNAPPHLATMPGGRFAWCAIVSGTYHEFGREDRDDLKSTAVFDYPAYFPGSPALLEPRPLRRIEAVWLSSFFRQQALNLTPPLGLLFREEKPLEACNIKAFQVGGRHFPPPHLKRQ